VRAGGSERCSSCSGRSSGAPRGETDRGGPRRASRCRGFDVPAGPRRRALGGSAHPQDAGRDRAREARPRSPRRRSRPQPPRCASGLHREPPDPRRRSSRAPPVLCRWWPGSGRADLLARLGRARSGSSDEEKSLRRPSHRAGVCGAPLPPGPASRDRQAAAAARSFAAMPAARSCPPPGLPTPRSLCCPGWRPRTER